MGLLDLFRKKPPPPPVDPTKLDLFGPTILGLQPRSDRAALKALAEADACFSIEYAESEPMRIALELVDLRERPARLWPGTVQVAGNDKPLRSTTALDVWTLVPRGALWRGDDTVLEIAIPHVATTKFVVCSRINGALLRVFVEVNERMRHWHLQYYADSRRTPELGKVLQGAAQVETSLRNYCGPDGLDVERVARDRAFDHDGTGEREVVIVRRTE